MEKIKNSFAVKVASYIMILICMVVVVFSTIVIAINVDLSWYSKDAEQVEKDIYESTAWKAGDMLMDYIHAQNEDGYYEEDGQTKRRSAPMISDDEEIIEGESAATGFGYTIISHSDDIFFGTEQNQNAQRTVNQHLKSEPDIYLETFHHDMVEIEVYLGNINESNTPGDISNPFLMQKSIYESRHIAIAAGVMGILITISLFLYLSITVGKSYGREKETGKTGLLCKIPAEGIPIAGAGAIVAVVGSNSLIYPDDNPDLIIALLILDTLVITAVVLGAVLLLIMKGRQGGLLKSSVCYLLIRVAAKICIQIVKVLRYMGKGLRYLLESIPLVWKTATAVFAGILANLFITLLISENYPYGNAGMWIMWLAGAFMVEGFAVHTALSLRKLREGGKRLAAGELEHQIDKKGLFLDLAGHADDLNSIGQGMTKAVEEKMKSERFKTELITNVSHDIKTPLTSIINYVDLLKKEELAGEKAQEYVQVLDRQSQRLKKLTEDLVEASKAAAGTVNLDMRPCDAGILMMQVSGEYQEKADRKDLKIVSRIPDGALYIMADGKSMWRILNNLFDNICKYSQPGTRVYQTLENCNGKAVITYKNTSEHELNITEEELMERFVRGDSSRHTEGSGLGLSIAKNLTELQDGAFSINIDGDLFKTAMEFPLIKP